ncbi:MAG: CoA transferase [Rhodobacteraceae bacterium]|nr:MAG: CoA transferase [Paracoccaceae bacterium]
MNPALPHGPLTGLRVLDLSRVLAAPTCSQLLGDLGAEIVKVERPGTGDETRHWGPPFLQDAEGRDTPESAYYLSANRNKRSIAVDISKPEGVAVIRRLAETADVALENFKVGDLARRGLGYDDLAALNPRIVYCSLTGFGQTGPYASRPGYDFLAQGMGGIMSVTGQPDGPPIKVGVGIADVMTGMYATVAILAALRARDTTDRGQHIDVSLFDSQLAWLVNQGLDFLTDGRTPVRRGNAHPTIVPYDTFPTADGWLILAIGNDRQFAKFCEEAGRPELSDDPLFALNRARVANRVALTALLSEITRTRTTAEWLAALERVGVPSGPVNDIPSAFADPHAVARGARITMPHPVPPSGTVDLIGNPIKLSDTPVSYRHAPPTLGQHTREILDEHGFSEEEIRGLAEIGAVAGDGL